MSRKDPSPVTGNTDTEFIVIGQITKPHGIRGELRVNPHTDVLERFHWLEQVYVGETSPRLMAVESARVHQGMILLKLTAVNDRNGADVLRGEWLMVPEAEALPLAEGEYFLFQLVGLTVVTDAGEALGSLNPRVIETGANNVFVVKGHSGRTSAARYSRCGAGD